MSQELLSWLLAHYGQEQMRPGLDRIREALAELLPQFSKSKIVIIAGTNGKGETTLRLSEQLKDYSHYVWTSPHILRITERFRSEKGEISDVLLKVLVEEAHQEVRSKKIDLSFYEFLFFVFCKWAALNPPEYLLLEVGLGGRLDAVNVFDADLVLLPSISRDHQEILGKRYDKILFEKLGTLRSKSTLIHYLESKYLQELAQSYSSNMGAKVISLSEKSSIPSYEFSRRNDQLSRAAFTFLTGKTACEEMTQLEHRGETKKGLNEWIFYGSHNVDGMRKLIQFLHSGTYNFSRPPYDLVIAAFSKRDPRDLKAMLRMLSRSGLGKIVITSFTHPKAQDADSMRALAKEEGLEFVQDINSYVQEQCKNQRVLVTGSYYFLGHLKSLPCCSN